MTHQAQPQQCSHCFCFESSKYGKLEKCPGGGNGKACKLLETPRARMGPYMKELEKLVGYTSLKVKYSRLNGTPGLGFGSMEEKTSEEDDIEVSPEMIFKNPVVERDEKILQLEKEQNVLRKELPILQEKLKKSSKQLEAERKNKKQKLARQTHALRITEQKVAESIRSDPTFLSNNPHLIALLALFQEREDFEVDEENMIVKPVKEKDFLRAIQNDIVKLNEKSELPLPENLCKERLVEVKNRVLENVKDRWFQPSGNGRRHSNASQISTGSKRGRNGSDEDANEDRTSRVKVTDQ